MKSWFSFTIILGVTLIGCLCETCEKGSYLDAYDRCQPCAGSVQNCAECQPPKSGTRNPVCTSCSERFSLVERKSQFCYGDPESCKYKTCVPNCEKGTYLDDYDSCKSCNADSVQYCAECQPPKSGSRNPVCTSCPEGFSLIEKTPEYCFADSESCIYRTCQINCEKGTYSDGNKCTPCKKGCVACTGANQCTACAPGFLFSHGSCDSCLSLFKGANCTTCQQGDYDHNQVIKPPGCTSCPEGYSLVETMMTPCLAPAEFNYMCKAMKCEITSHFSFVLIMLLVLGILAVGAWRFGWYVPILKFIRKEKTEEYEVYLSS